MSMLKPIAMVALAPLAIAACGDNGDSTPTNASESALEPRTRVDTTELGFGKDVRTRLQLPTGSSKDAPRGPLPPGQPVPAESPAPPRMIGAAPSNITPLPDCHGAACSDCGDGSFCDLVDSGHCDDRSAPGFCRPKLFSVMCPMVYEPVCGCDGKTYANTCERMRAGVALDFGGPCEGTTSGTTSAP